MTSDEISYDAWVQHNEGGSFSGITGGVHAPNSDEAALLVAEEYPSAESVLIRRTFSAPGANAPIYAYKIRRSVTVVPA